MSSCVYIAVWGFTEAKETLLKYYDEKASKLVEKDDMDFIHLSVENEHSVLLFNLPMRATPKDPAIQYILHIAHAHILVDSGLEFATVIKASIPKCDGTGLVYSWHPADVEAAGLELIAEPTNAAEAIALLQSIVKTTVQRNLLLPPIMPMQILGPPVETVVPMNVNAEAQKRNC